MMSASIPIHTIQLTTSLLGFPILTGEVQTVNQSSKANDLKTCFSLSEDSFPAECSPYEVIVTAHNKVGFSDASNVTLQGTKRFIPAIL